jgi:hypothetical protein
MIISELESTYAAYALVEAGSAYGRLERRLILYAMERLTDLWTMIPFCCLFVIGRRCSVGLNALSRPVSPAPKPPFETLCTFQSGWPNELAGGSTPVNCLAIQL